MALPAFGMISEVIPVFSRKPIFGYEFVAGSTVAIAVLSFGVWAHHMFAVGLGRTADLFFAAGSMLIAVPTGVKIFNWIATMWGGSIRFTTAMLFAVAFLLEFVIGGLSGITFAVGADRLADDRHLLRRRALPLRALRRHRLRHLRGHLLLVPEDERARCSTSAGAARTSG